eukprot:3098230-Rhodomonas_salina.1
MPYLLTHCPALHGGISLRALPSTDLQYGAITLRAPHALPMHWPVLTQRYQCTAGTGADLCATTGAKRRVFAPLAREKSRFGPRFRAAYLLQHIQICCIAFGTDAVYLLRHLPGTHGVYLVRHYWYRIGRICYAITGTKSGVSATFCAAFDFSSPAGPPGTTHRCICDVWYCACA